MPLFELFRLARGRLGSDQENPDPADSSSAPGNGFSELARENGQVVMQGQCSPRDKKSLSLSSNSFVAHGSKLGAEDNARDSKIGNLCFGLSEYPNVVPSPEIGLNQDADMVPWMTYPFSGSLNNDYSSDFLPELPGVAVNVTSLRNNICSASKTGQGQECRDSLFSSLQNENSLEEGARMKSSNMQLFTSSLPLQSEIFPGSNLKLQRNDSGPSSNAASVKNFSYLVRPTAVVRSNRNSGHNTCDLDLSGVERAGNRETGASVDITNGKNSKLVVSSSNLGKGVVPCYHNSVQQQRYDPELLKGMSSKELASSQKHETVILEDTMKGKKEKFSNESRRPGGTKAGMADNEKTLEGPVGSSSVCSGNSVERALNDLEHGFKRKFHETEGSKDWSEDIGDELVSVKRQTTPKHDSLKRSRTSEVHNLSERRRRDRINEKMRALQELIPNCCKVDKASMLDEAIAYVKTLKFQLQMMTMGAGFYVPPMMHPTGMQHMGNMPFSTGVSRGMGYGMGVPLTSMHGTYFQSPFMPAYQAMPGSNPHMYAFHGQGLMPSPSRPGTKTSTGPSNAHGAPSAVENKHHRMVSCWKGSAQSINKHSSHTTGSSCLSKQQNSSQSLVVSNNGQASDKKNNAKGASDTANREEPRPKETGG